jgi:hypothetical protein
LEKGDAGEVEWGKVYEGETSIYAKHKAYLSTE